MTGQSRRIRVVDVFTDKALAGNQLAVVLDGRGFSDHLMQRIAREMNFSETTFVLPPSDPAHAARVRIFTPFTELPFAGHPTLGTAWVLRDESAVESLEFVLEEKGGPVPVRSEERDGAIRFWMTHPQARFGEVFPHAHVAAAIGVDETRFIDGVPAQVAQTGYPVLFAALHDREAVDAAVSDHARLRRLFAGHAVDIVYFFAPVGGNRLYSRMFSLDIVEDPATGGAAGPLGAFAVRYGLIERAPTVSILSEQGTKIGRQSLIHIALAYGEESEEVPARIEVGGSIVPVLSGELAELE